MTARDFSATLRTRIAALNANRAAEVLRITFDLLALVKLRIQTSGENFREAQFPPYTRQYANRRAKAGYQVGYVDFTVSGDLWRNVRPEVIANTDTITEVEVTARDSGNQNKLRGAVEKRGNILLPSQREIALAGEANRERIRKYLTI